MSTAEGNTPGPDKVTLPCPQCRQNLTVPASAIGKHSRCPNCLHVFPLDPVINATVVDEPAQQRHNFTDEPQSVQPAPLSTPTATNIPNPYAPSTAQTTAGKYQHGFGWEHRGWDSGMKGGLAMMAVAALWFFGGLAFGIIFYYPPILFVIGLVGFFRGLFTGNVSGR